jgi:site-specific recombinase XerD
MSLEPDADACLTSAWLPCVLAQLAHGETLSEQSRGQMQCILSRFDAFLRVGCGMDRLDAVDAADVESFIRASRSRPSTAPSIATMHLRRSAVRLAFRIGRELGLVMGDPTLDLRLPPRSSLVARPLMDEEVALCRSSSLSSLTETRRPAAWALAEATARTSEISAIRACDVDLASRMVSIQGGAKTEPRSAPLSGWGALQIERRMRALGAAADTDVPLVGSSRGSGESRQASSCIAISDVLTAAGLGGERDVRPASVAAWAGATAFRDGASIEEVARMLGVRSLDAAARLIGFDWRSS